MSRRLYFDHNASTPIAPEVREAMEPFLTVAARPVDELYRLVRGSGCAVLLTDADGILLDRRASAADAPAPAPRKPNIVFVLLDDARPGGRARLCLQ